MKQKGADYAYINVTTTGVSLVLKGAKALGLATKFGSNPYGFSEQLPLVAKEAAEGVTGVVPHVPYGTPVPGMKALEAYHKANHPTDTHDALYVRGWAVGHRSGSRRSSGPTRPASSTARASGPRSRPSRTSTWAAWPARSPGPPPTTAPPPRPPSSSSRAASWSR